MREYRVDNFKGNRKRLAVQVGTDLHDELRRDSCGEARPPSGSPSDDGALGGAALDGHDAGGCGSDGSRDLQNRLGEAFRRIRDLEEALRRGKSLHEQKDRRIERLCSQLEELAAASVESSQVIYVGNLEQKKLGERLSALNRDLRELSLVAAPPQAAPPDEDDASQEEPSGLYGPLSEVAVTEVVEFVRLTKKTGVLKVVSQEFEGRVEFHEGDAVFAEAGPAAGFDAFCEVLKQQVGYLEFQSSPVSPQKRNLKHSTYELMMRALCLLDERDSQMRR